MLRVLGARVLGLGFGGFGVIGSRVWGARKVCGSFVLKDLVFKRPRSGSELPSTFLRVTDCGQASMTSSCRLLRGLIP